MIHVIKGIFLAGLATVLMMSSAHATNPDNQGWVVKDAVGSVDETADKLVAIIENAPPKLFARVDHAAGAKNINQELPDSVMVMFGAPAIGTPIMQSNIRAGLDLPIRVLIWDEGGQTKIGYLDPAALAERYKVDGADKALKQMTGALNKFTDGAAK